jgi:energy-coupling factor transporter ATP-binding protein EcfA2
MQVLKDVGFAIEKGKFVSITGKSGSGKSTLLYLLSTMNTDYETCFTPLRVPLLPILLAQCYTISAQPGTGEQTSSQLPGFRLIRMLLRVLGHCLG